MPSVFPGVAVLKIAGPLFLCLFAVGCASGPPAPPTAAQLAAPHHVLVDEARATVPVDANLDLSRVTAIPLSPVGLIIAAAVTVGDAAVNSITEANRTARRDELAARLGETGSVSSDFASRFNAEFRQRLAEVPTLQVERFDQAPRGAQIQLGNGASLRLHRDIVLTTDGRFLVARAITMHTVGEGTARRNIVRHFVVFSEPVDAASEEEALGRWTAEDSRLMRDQARPLAAELASLIRLAVFSTEALDLDRMPLRRLPTSGVSIPLGTAQDGREGAFWAAPRPLSYEMRRDVSRVVTVSVLGREANRWTWISLPASLLPVEKES